MKTSIRLENIQFYAHHGVGEQERTVGNRFAVSLTLYFPFAEAAATDRLEATLNYAEVYDIVKGEMLVPSRLLEHVAGRIRRALVEAFPKIEGGRISVRKLCPPIPGAQMDFAAAEIEW